MDEFASLISPGKKLDRNYLVLRKKKKSAGFDWDQFVIVDRKDKSKELAKLSYRIENKEMRITEVFTHSEFRKLGLQSTLMKFAEQEAKEKNCKSMVLMSSRKGIPFYRKIGFKSRGIFPEFTKTPSDNIDFPAVKTKKEKNLKHKIEEIGKNQFMSLIRPDLPRGKTDKNYMVVKEGASDRVVTFRVLDMGKKGNKPKEVARASYMVRSDRVTLDNVWTAEKYRNLNLQNMLIDLVGQEARNTGKKRITLRSEKESVPFYRKLGFKKEVKSETAFPRMSKKTPKITESPKVNTLAERRKKRRK